MTHFTVEEIGVLHGLVSATLAKEWLVLTVLVVTLELLSSRML